MHPPRFAASRPTPTMAARQTFTPRARRSAPRPDRTPPLVSRNSFWNTPRMTTPQTALALGPGLSLPDVVSVARGARHVELSDTSRHATIASRAVVEAALRDGVPLYGINTGFGSLSRAQIAPGKLLILQHNLVRSHACGVGESLPDEV